MVHNFGTVLLCPQNLAVSGANQVLHNIAAGNLYRGNVILVSPCNGPFATKFTELGVSVRIGLVEDVLASVRDVRFAICNTIMTAHIVNTLTRRGVPCAWVLHEWWTRDMIPVELANRNDKNLTLQTVDEALATCAATISVCRAQQALYGPKRGEVIYVGTPDVDIRHFPPPTAHAANVSQGSLSKKPRGVTTFLCMGIVCPRKNQAFTVKCFKAFAGDRQDVRLLVVGVRRIRDYEIAYVEQVEQEIAGDRRIELHDVTHEVDDFYAAADVVVLASLNEVTPMVLAEAMARGRPVLTTGIAGIPEMLDDGVEGFICGEEDTPECTKQWAERMAQLANCPDLRRSMGAAGAARYHRQFRLGHMVDQYRQVALRLAKPVVLVDMDGCLVDWDRGFLEAWGGRTLVDRKHYQMEKCLPAERLDEAVSLFCSEGFFRGLPAMPGGIHALAEMLHKGFEVIICTSPIAASRYCAQEKWEWVREHLGEEWLPRLMLTMDKTTVRGDVLIDDKPHITGSQQPLWTHVLFDAPYNREVELDGRRRLAGWQDWGEVLAAELAVVPGCEMAGEDTRTTGNLKTVPSDNSVCSLASAASVTADDVAKMRDFSSELEGTSYLQDYRKWRRGGSKGAKGEFSYAVAEIERIHRQAFLDGDDWSSVHAYRFHYQNWRKGKARGAKDMGSQALGEITRIIAGA